MSQNYSKNPGDPIEESPDLRHGLDILRQWSRAMADRWTQEKSGDNTLPVTFSDGKKWVIKLIAKGSDIYLSPMGEISENLTLTEMLDRDEFKVEYLPQIRKRLVDLFDENEKRKSKKAK